MMTHVEAADALEEAARTVFRARTCKTVDSDVVTDALGVIEDAVAAQVPWACRGLEQVAKASADAGFDAYVPDDIAKLIEGYGKLRTLARRLTSSELSDAEIHMQVKAILQDLGGMNRDVARVLGIPM